MHTFFLFETLPNNVFSSPRKLTFASFQQIQTISISLNSFNALLFIHLFHIVSLFFTIRCNLFSVTLFVLHMHPKPKTLILIYFPFFRYSTECSDSLSIFRNFLHEIPTNVSPFIVYNRMDWLIIMRLKF